MDCIANRFHCDLEICRANKFHWNRLSPTFSCSFGREARDLITFSMQTLSICDYRQWLVDGLNFAIFSIACHGLVFGCLWNKHICTVHGENHPFQIHSFFFWCLFHWHLRFKYSFLLTLFRSSDLSVVIRILPLLLKWIPQPQLAISIYLETVSKRWIKWFNAP